MGNNIPLYILGTVVDGRDLKIVRTEEDDQIQEAALGVGRLGKRYFATESWPFYAAVIALFFYLISFF